ncbi:hypothetical protein VEE68_14610 [Escherichia coli]|nr:hypothetical protein VEE68_14610 [Escherichia coli]
MRLLPLVAAATAAFLVVACSSPTPPRGVTVVNNFDAKRYLGTWYEIARFDHRFERGLEKVTATYSLRDDGGLNVINKGYNPDRGMWQQSEGKAYFTGAPTRAALKVSFFGPFYGGYKRYCTRSGIPPCAGLRPGPRLPVDTLPHANHF